MDPKHLYLGIDLGTSAVKILLVDEDGKVIRTESREYPLVFPNPGWSEQEPEDWWKAVIDGVKAIMRGIDPGLVDGIGCGGQMHGLVILDSDDNVIRPAILWNDGRTFREVDYLNNVIGKQRLSELTANIAFAGFTAPKVLWVKNNEPENFFKISKLMLPKDYINYKLTGVHCCDYSDASGMLLLDVKHKCWSKEMLSVCGIEESIMPGLYESADVVGCVKPDVAKQLGLSGNVKVIAGAGDNAAAAVGTGIVGDGGCNISLGTSGTVFISSEKFRVDTNNALHAFAHADGGYHLMGCMLSAASCNKWLCEDIFGTSDYAGEQKNIEDKDLGENRTFFLPYLMGERSPINDTDARAAFVGMSMDTTRKDMILSVLEGVAFAIRDSVEVAKSLGIKIESSRICGGGAKSPLWRKIIANVLNIRLEIPSIEEGPGYGGALLAMVGCGRFSSVKEAADSLCGISAVIYPDETIQKKYEKKYGIFKQIYPSLKSLYKTMKEN